MGYRVIHGRIERFAVHYKGHKFHALLCDPPYELGFMGKDWDKSGIAFHPDTWAALSEHMLPGAFGMAFASARGWHRLACAIEDAGLRIHPSIWGWVQSQGFPKATRVKDSPAFDGHRYGLQAIKPALEPIIVFQKPYEGKPVDSITATGAGALWIDGARIRLADGESPYSYPNGSGGSHGPVPIRKNYTNPIIGNPKGRWPANFYVDEEAARRLGEQSGVTTTGGQSTGKFGGVFGNGRKASQQIQRDTGTAARFFLNVDWALEEADPVLYCPKAGRKERDAGLDEMPLKERPGMFDDDNYEWKDGGHVVAAPRKNGHPTVKPIKLTQWLATLLLPPEEYAPRRILVPFAGSGSEMIGAVLAGWDEVVGIEMEREYCEIAEARLEHWTKQRQPVLGLNL